MAETSSTWDAIREDLAQVLRSPGQDCTVSITFAGEEALDLHLRLTGLRISPSMVFVNGSGFSAWTATLRYGSLEREAFIADLLSLMAAMTMAQSSKTFMA